MESSMLVSRTRTWFSFAIQLQSRRILITFLPRSCLSWERTRNLCRMIALRSAHSLPKNSRMLLSMETLRSSRCSPSGPFGRRQQFFMRNTTARRRKPIPDRYSRHYYDVAMLAQGPIRADALADKDLLTQVVRHKETFYPSAWARYDLARPGSFRLSPVENRIAALERDYRNMAVMIFGDAAQIRLDHGNADGA